MRKSALNPSEQEMRMDRRVEELNVGREKFNQIFLACHTLTTSEDVYAI